MGRDYVRIFSVILSDLFTLHYTTWFCYIPFYLYKLALRKYQTTVLVKTMIHCKMSTVNTILNYPVQHKTNFRIGVIDIYFNVNLPNLSKP